MFYAVSVGRVPGVYTSWERCLEQVHDFPGARHRRFGSELDAYAYVDAQRVLDRVASRGKGRRGAAVEPFVHGPTGVRGVAVEVFVDGACSNNGRATARAAYGVFFGEGDPDNVGAPLPPEAGKHTNNRAELYAVLAGLRLALARLDRDAEGDGVAVVATDSRYAILALRRAAAGRPAERPPPNADLIDAVVAAMDGRAVVVRHVPGHRTPSSPSDRDAVGNREADRLATGAVP